MTPDELAELNQLPAPDLDPCRLCHPRGTPTSPYCHRCSPDTTSRIVTTVEPVIPPRPTPEPPGTCTYCGATAYLADGHCLRCRLDGHHTAPDPAVPAPRAADDPELDLDIPTPREPGPPRDLFAPDPHVRCLQCRAGSHRACRGPRQCHCTDHRHTDRQEATR